MKKPTCLLTVFCRMYTELCMCSSIYILAHCLHAGVAALFCIHRSDIIPHWLIRMAEDWHLEETWQKKSVHESGVMWHFGFQVFRAYVLPWWHGCLLAERRVHWQCPHLVLMTPAAVWWHHNKHQQEQSATGLNCRDGSHNKVFWVMFFFF